MGQPSGRRNAGCYRIRTPRSGAFGVTGSQAERGCLAASDSTASPVAHCAHSAGLLSDFPSLGPLPELEDIGFCREHITRDVAGLDPFLLCPAIAGSAFAPDEAQPLQKFNAA